MGTGDFDEQLGRAELAEPESNVRRRRVLAMLEVVRLHESPDHRPVLVALGLLGSDQVGQRHEIAREPAGQGDRRAASPQRRERRHTTHPGHDVDAHVKGVRMPAAEMHGVAPPQILKPERRNGNDFCLQIRQGAAEPGEIASVGEHDEVGVPAKLRRAVEHARLPSHEEGADPVRPHRRKDFAYRVPDQGVSPTTNRSARVSRSPATARLASDDTTPPIPHRQALPERPWWAKMNGAPARATRPATRFAGGPALSSRASARLQHIAKIAGAAAPTLTIAGGVSRLSPPGRRFPGRDPRDNGLAGVLRFSTPPWSHR